MGAYARQTFLGINIFDAFKSTFPLLLGALSAKFAAKKFAPEDSPGSEGDNWTWKNYGLALIGGFVAAWIGSAIFRGRRSIAQKIMEGAFLLTAYKIFTNEIAPANEYLESWFGEDEDYLPEMGQDIYPTDIMEGTNNELEARPGDIWQAQGGEQYVMGSDGAWRPIGEGHRIPQFTDGVGDDVQPVDPTMGDDVQPVDPTMGGMGQVVSAFKRKYSDAA